LPFKYTTCSATAGGREAERWLPALQPRHLHVINGTPDKFAFDHVRGAMEARRALRKRGFAAGAGFAPSWGGDEVGLCRLNQVDP
jgi:hypothetical protein